MFHLSRRPRPLFDAGARRSVLTKGTLGQSERLLDETCSYCRADPVLALSDGAVLELELAIQDKLEQIQRVSFVLHGPVGTSLAAVVYPNGTGAISTVSYCADQPENTYVGHAVVTARRPGSRMTAYLAVVQLPWHGDPLTAAASPTPGFTGQELVVALTPSRDSLAQQRTQAS